MSHVRNAVAVAILAVSVGCGNELTNEEKVQIVFDNFQPTLSKIIEAGLAAKSTSTQGANVSPVVRDGGEKGTLTVGGKVAQSAGLNQNLDLWVQLEGEYSDTGKIFYQTDNTDNTTKPQLGIQIQNQPSDNSMSGTLVGPMTISGDVDGTATFNVRFISDLEDDDAAPTVICSHVKGSVTANDTTKELDFLLPVDTSGLSQAQIDKCTAYAP
jgi:hypothetical protein